MDDVELAILVAWHALAPRLTTLADAVGQAGLHVLIYGERGVGKTSLANVGSSVDSHLRRT